VRLDEADVVVLAVLVVASSNADGAGAVDVGRRFGTAETQQPIMLAALRLRGP